jgi:copper resistance protein C
MATGRDVRILVAIFLCFSWPLLAHAILLSANPSANQVVEGQKIPVTLRFNARIDAKRSRLVLVDPGGREIPLAIEDQPTPDTLGATVQGLTTGLYLLRWQVLAADGHITRGEVPFRAK